MPIFSADEACARSLDAGDALSAQRDLFHIPKQSDGRDAIYFAGNSLGLMPKATPDAIAAELDAWGAKAVGAHFDSNTPWYAYHEVFRDSGAKLVGALPGEVVMMNSLTVNLHLMMISFYRPTKQRYKIVMEEAAFPSDTYAIKSQLAHHGIDPQDGLLIARPRDGEHYIRTNDIEALLEEEGEKIALVLMGGVSYFTGQLFDIQRITAVAKQCGCVVGWDLAHVAGNVPLKLHDWDVDFAVWCNYKYLNSGPGAVAGCYVHERHGANLDLPRLAGWWGNDPDTRFRMHLQPDFVPRVGADGWQISNPPIMALAPVKASYDIFDDVGIDALREKSLRLTGYLEFLIDQLPAGRFEVVTPRDPNERGCQLSILVHDRPKELLAALHGEGVVCDFREPNVIRVAPVPLYNTFHEVWSLARILAQDASGATQS